MFFGNGLTSDGAKDYGSYRKIPDIATVNLTVWYGASDKIAEKKPEEIMRDILHEDVEGNGDNSHVLPPERFRKRPPAV